MDVDMNENTTEWLAERIESLKRHPVTASEYWTLLDDCKAELAKQAEEIEWHSKLVATQRKVAANLEREKIELLAANAKQAERVAALEGVVHECPKCGESCKECNCHRTEVRELVEALRLLYDVQNGCPLPKYEQDWNLAMDKATDILAKHESKPE